MKADLLDGKSIAKQVRREVEKEVSNLRNEYGIKPCLAVVLVGNDPASQVYVHNKQKAAIEVGMMARDIKIPASITQNEQESIVADLGNDQHIHGLLIQLPLPTAEVVATATYAAVAAVATTTLATPFFDQIKKKLTKFLQGKINKWKENRKKKKDSLVS